MGNLGMEDHNNYSQLDACLHNMLDDCKDIHTGDGVDKDLPYRSFCLYV